MYSNDPVDEHQIRVLLYARCFVRHVCLGYWLGVPQTVTMAELKDQLVVMEQRVQSTATTITAAARASPHSNDANKTGTDETSCSTSPPFSARSMGDLDALIV